VKVDIRSELSALYSELSTWFWVPKYWMLIYSLLTVVGIMVGNILGPSMFWAVFLIGVPLTVAPVTYRNLVGGGCSLRFQICALVKGMLVGIIFLFVTILADGLLWAQIASTVGWTPLNLGTTTSLIYQVWMYSGLIGGMGARVIEVRGYAASSEELTIIEP
jgi:hypothetical protein